MPKSIFFATESTSKSSAKDIFIVSLAQSAGEL